MSPCGSDYSMILSDPSIIVVEPLRQTDLAADDLRETSLQFTRLFDDYF